MSLRFLLNAGIDCKNTFLLIVVCGMLSSCSSIPQATIEYPYGPITVTGAIASADVSFVRRGTHIIQMVDAHHHAYYLESKREDLQEFVGQTVGISGMLEPNTHEKFLPVVVVEHVQSTQSRSRPKQWKLPSVGIAVTVPDIWQFTHAGEGVRFLRSQSGEVLLSIEPGSGSFLPAGDPVYVGSLRGVRVADADGGQQIFASTSGATIRFHFSSAYAELRRTQIDSIGSMEGILESVHLLSATKGGKGTISPAASAVSSLKKQNLPCGGPAGIVCPAGSYCAVTDVASAIGICQAIE